MENPGIVTVSQIKNRSQDLMDIERGAAVTGVMMKWNLNGDRGRWY